MHELDTVMRQVVPGFPAPRSGKRSWITWKKSKRDMR